MFVKRRKQLGSTGNSPQVVETSSPVNVPVANGSVGRKSGPISTTPVSAGPPAKGLVAVKREEKDGSVGRRSDGAGSTSNVRGSGQGSPAIPAMTLDTVLPGMQSVLFSADANNLQKARELKKLCACLKEWGSVNDQTLLKLIQNLKLNVESLDEKMTPLVHEVLSSDWCSRSGKVVKAYEDFLSELLVVRSFFSRSVMHALIQKLVPTSAGDPTSPDDIPISDQRVFDIAHRNLKKLIETIPRMRDCCLGLMATSYPYMLGRKPFVHYCYVHNILQVGNYAPHYKTGILQLIIHKLCRIDVNVPKEDVESLHEMLSEEELSSMRVKYENGGDSFDVKLDREQVINNVIYNSCEQVNPLVNILDLCMCLVFESLEKTVVGENVPESTLGAFYESLFETFDREVLPSFGINHVQFIYFYLLSVHPPYCQKFMELMWKKVISVNTAAIVRIQCVSYIAGILARANYATVKILKRWLTRLADWANLYVDSRVGGSHWAHVNVQTHGPFYAVCQAIFYVFAFRNKDLIGSKKCTAFTGTLNLGRLVTCDLNPLKAVVEPVAIAFVKAAHTHQISYCRTVLERNQRATIPTSVRNTISVSAMDALDTVGSTLESFFPFDPYNLPRSRRWVDSMYRIYEPYLPDLKVEKQESPTHWSDPQNEDSIEMDLSSSYRDQSCSHFISAGLMESSDMRDEFMDL